jgi:DNA repair protein RadC
VLKNGTSVSAEVEERLAKIGPAALSTLEILQIVASPKAAEKLADRPLPDLARLTYSELRSNGITKKDATRLVAVLEIARRQSACEVRERRLANEPAKVIAYLRAQYSHLTQERTGALYLDARNRLLRDAECFRGTLDRTMAEPREIFKTALLENAAAVIVYHNHPSGDPTPSREDREFTKRLAAAAEIVGIRLLDHVVIGTQGGVSFRETGLL